MRTRIMVNGKPAWSENEEGGYARRAGFGGAAIGHFSGTIFKVGPSPAVRSAAAQRSADRKRAARAAEAAVRGST